MIDRSYLPNAPKEKREVKILLEKKISNDFLMKLKFKRLLFSTYGNEFHLFSWYNTINH